MLYMYLCKYIGGGGVWVFTPPIGTIYFWIGKMVAKMYSARFVELVLLGWKKYLHFLYLTLSIFMNPITYSECLYCNLSQNRWSVLLNMKLQNIWLADSRGIETGKFNAACTHHTETKLFAEASTHCQSLPQFKVVLHYWNPAMERHLS